MPDANRSFKVNTTKSSRIRFSDSCNLNTKLGLANDNERLRRTVYINIDSFPFYPRGSSTETSFTEAINKDFHAFKWKPFSLSRKYLFTHISHNFTFTFIILIVSPNWIVRTNTMFWLHKHQSIKHSTIIKTFGRIPDDVRGDDVSIYNNYIIVTSRNGDVKKIPKKKNFCYARWKRQRRFTAYHFEWSKRVFFSRRKFQRVDGTNEIFITGIKRNWGCGVKKMCNILL